ncbi:MAG TPA: hybrid sensor histidine kinase/response regulator, partial [Thermoanaerobaculia bacterium]
LTGYLARWQVLARGYMPPLSAVALVLAALALASHAFGRRREALYAQLFALVVLGISGVGLAGHVYGLEDLLSVVPFTGVSFPALVGLLVAGLGLLLARPEVGIMTLVVDPTAGGASVRRLLPVTILVILMAGALRVWGEGRGFFPGALGTALFSVSVVFLIGALIVWNALRLREAERSLLREQEIRTERQRQFRHAIVEAPVPVLMFADDGAVLQVSRAVEEITGYAPEEIPDLDAWERLVTEDREGAGAGAAPDLRACLGEFREAVVRTRSGQRRTWRIRTSSLGHLNDEREAFVAMATDLTEIREAEERKDEFLAVLGHELRNPLAALATGLELQRLHEDPERREAIGAMMSRQVSHLARLLDDLLDVSRISRGKIALQLQALSLNEALERAVEEHRDLTPEGGRPRISLGTPPRPVAVVADPTRLHQILGNLLGNAVKYTPADGRGWVTLEREEDEAAIRVRDTGIGMDEHEIAAVFEPFRQLGQDAGRRRGGLGLGLTLVRQLAGLHGGSVSAASRGPGQGSTFTLRLPVAGEGLLAAHEAEAAAAEAEAPAPVTAAPTPLRVLVVDDQAEVADGLVELLGLSGHRATAAYCGNDALELAERERPDVLLLDLDLPDLDGRTVARRIRERGGDPSPLLVAVSGFGGDRHFERSREAGIDRHLVKPVDIDQVLELLRGVSLARAAG